MYLDCVINDIITQPPKYPSNWKNALLDSLICSYLLWDCAKIFLICLKISIILIYQPLEIVLYQRNMQCSQITLVFTTTF